MFGMTQGCFSCSLDLGMSFLYRCLRKLPRTRTEWPSSEKIPKFCSMIRNKEPSFVHVFGFVDGLNLPMQNHWDADLQSAVNNSSRKEMLVESALNNLRNDGRSCRLLLWDEFVELLRQDRPVRKGFIDQVPFLGHKVIDPTSPIGHLQLD